MVDIREVTAQIVAAYVRGHQIEAEKLPELIKTVSGTLANLGGSSTTANSNSNPEAAASAAEAPKPAVPPSRSVFADYIVCLDCAKKATMLKRHLMTAHGLTTDAYRQRWGLASNYPMSAPNYAKKRSALAKAMGLGSYENTSRNPPARRASRKG